jgi:hypothetical protein
MPATGHQADRSGIVNITRAPMGLPVGSACRAAPVRDSNPNIDDPLRSGVAPVPGVSLVGRIAVPTGLGAACPGS